jgi:hypothetical protein
MPPTGGIAASGPYCQCNSAMVCLSLWNIYKNARCVLDAVPAQDQNQTKYLLCPNPV